MAVKSGLTVRLIICTVPSTVFMHLCKYIVHINTGTYGCVEGQTACAHPLAASTASSAASSSLTLSALLYAAYADNTHTHTHTHVTVT